MLSEQSATTVRATLPAVGGALGEISDRFYAGLFAAHPELLRDLFNRGNQASGTQRQALAGAIAAFAAHLVERPDERPDTMLSRIAHKHASLGIARSSTRSSTSTSSQRSPASSAKRSPPRSRPPGTRSTG
jgi:nitric oxide dioxygenase